MSVTELLRLDATAQLEALTAGRVTAVALAEAHLDAIASAQPSLNAFIATDPERTLAAARESDGRRKAGSTGRLEGLPIAVKDNLDVAGWRTTAGMATRRDRVPATQDSVAAARLRAAGAVILGKLSLHEAALGADNDNPHYGACHHPRRPGYTPGGSSGGSGAAVAAHLCAAALGTDSMGSVRIPSSYCGVFGLKPSYGLVSPRGAVVVSRRLDHVGPLARSARDLGLLLEVLSGFDVECAESRRVLLQPARGGSLAIGVPDLSDLAVDDDVIVAFEAGLAQLRALGHRIAPLPGPTVEPGRLRRAGLLVCEAEMLVEHAEDWARRRADFSPALAGMLAWAESKSAREFAAADRLLDAGTVTMQRWLAGCDLIAWPTTPQRAFAFGSPVPANQADLTCLANMSGVPALSLPLPVGETEWPIGMQLIGSIGSERTLIAVAGALAAQRGS
jgi:aspartyl-tRNA(Asn)/glutamyl-tRNA(Gln) amidotransferase subunit A